MKALLPAPLLSTAPTSHNGSHRSQLLSRGDEIVRTPLLWRTTVVCLPGAFLPTDLSDSFKARVRYHKLASGATGAAQSVVERCQGTFKFLCQCYIPSVVAGQIVSQDPYTFSEGAHRKKVKSSNSRSLWALVASDLVICSARSNLQSTLLPSAKTNSGLARDMREMTDSAHRPAAPMSTKAATRTEAPTTLVTRTQNLRYFYSRFL